MTGWYEPSLTFPASAFSEVNQDVRIMRGGGRTEDPSQVDNCAPGETPGSGDAKSMEGRTFGVELK